MHAVMFFSAYIQLDTDRFFHAYVPSDRWDWTMRDRPIRFEIRIIRTTMFDDSEVYREFVEMPRFYFDHRIFVVPHRSGWESRSNRPPRHPNNHHPIGATTMPGMDRFDVLVLHRDYRRK